MLLGEGYFGYLKKLAADFLGPCPACPGVEKLTCHVELVVDYGLGSA